MKTTNNANDLNGMESSDLLDTLKITSTEGRKVGGTWVKGTIAGHRFEGLVFPEAAEVREWEVNQDSRISKLWVQRIADRIEVYNWDRGADVEPKTAMARQIVDLLAAGLAESIFAN